MLFAQAGGGNLGLGPQEVIVLAVVGVFVVVFFVIKVLYLLTLSRCLQRIHPRNRRMQPGMVWLNLIPCFDLVWGFITVIRITESLDDEFYERRMDERGDDYGKSLGIAYMVCLVLSAIPYIGGCIYIAALVLWIMYWVKIARYSRQLHEAGGDDYQDLDDYDPAAG
jgi:hypothetical protein